MKSITRCLLILSVVLFASCKGEEPEPNPDPNPNQEILVGVTPALIGYSPLNSRADVEGLLAVQVYEVVDGGELIPYANGLFADWSKLAFKGFANSTYKVEATMVVDAENIIDNDGTKYGKPFSTALISGNIPLCETALSGISLSTATLKSDGEDYIIPSIDRYYGSVAKKVTSGDENIDTPMKRISFGVSVTGVSDPITIAIEGAPVVEIEINDINYFSLGNIISAYNADESSSPYSEVLRTQIFKGGVEIYNGDVLYKRNQLAKITIEGNDVSFGFEFEEGFEEGEDNGEDDDEIITPEDATAYLTKVFEYLPAPGQYVNTMPEYVDGDTQLSMNKKAEDLLVGGGMVTLGGYGGYVTVGFDHTIVNVEGENDFRVLGNSFYSASNPDPTAPVGGSCEPGIIMVAYDANKNNVPDADEWYEIAGSSHVNPADELWYQKALDGGLDVNFYRDYSITYTRPESEPTDEADYATYIKWSDNKDCTGYLPKNVFNSNAYYPQWITENLTFSGSRLPQNSINEAEAGSETPYYVLYKFNYGYADNDMDEDALINIEWAVDREGNNVKLPGVDFIKVYTGVNQESGWLGECSTEFSGIEDLHILERDAAK